MASKKLHSDKKDAQKVQRWFEDIIVNSFEPDNEKLTRENIDFFVKEKINETEDFVLTLIIQSCAKKIKNMTYREIEDFNDRVVHYRLEESDAYYEGEDEYKYSSHFKESTNEYEGYVPSNVSKENKIEEEEGNKKVQRSNNLFDLVFKSVKGTAIEAFLSGHKAHCFIILNTFEFENNKYAYLYDPIDKIKNVYIYKKDDKGEETLSSVTDKILLSIFAQLNYLVDNK